jgi:hypothetical protein
VNPEIVIARPSCQELITRLGASGFHVNIINQQPTKETTNMKQQTRRETAELISKLFPDATERTGYLLDFLGDNEPGAYRSLQLDLKHLAEIDAQR